MKLFGALLVTSFICFFPGTVAVSQNVFIKGSLTNYNQSSVPFFKRDLKQGKDLLIKPLSYTADSFSFTFMNLRPQLFSLLLNPVFIEPADTINFHFSFVDRPDGSFYDSVFAKGRYPGNYMYRNHFRRWDDGRPDLTGKDSTSLSKYYHSLKSFYFNTIRLRRDTFAQQYAISNNFKDFLEAELPFTFLKTLLTAYKYALVKVPLALRALIQNDIESSALNDSTLLDSEDYNGFLNLYGSYFLGGSDQDKTYSFARFKSNINKINQLFRGSNREFAIVKTTIMYSINRASYGDSAVDNYISVLTKQTTDSILQKSLIQFLNTRSNVNGTAFKNLFLKSINGDTLQMNDVLNRRGEITLIDFWASWCGPCHEQDPFLADVYKQKNDLHFVAISIDEDPVAWLKSARSNTNAFVHHYLILNPKESEKLTSIIGLHAIPRYVLLDKQNRLAYLNASMPKNTKLLMSEITQVEQMSETSDQGVMPPPPHPPAR